MGRGCQKEKRNSRKEKTLKRERPLQPRFMSPKIQELYQGILELNLTLLYNSNNSNKGVKNNPIEGTKTVQTKTF